MKKNSFLLLFVSASLFLISSFITKRSENIAGGTIHVYVKDANGNPSNYARVRYSVCNSLACVGSGSDVRTDKSGYVKLSWTSDCDICTIYVNGKAHEKNKYKNGETYTFSTN